jgi:hypothetical protein
MDHFLGTLRKGNVTFNLVVHGIAQRYLDINSVRLNCQLFFDDRFWRKKFDRQTEVKPQ